MVSENMTPLHLRVLLHYYTTPTEYDGVSVDSPVYKEFICWLLNEDLLVRTGGGGGGDPELRIGWRGKRFVEKLMECQP